MAFIKDVIIYNKRGIKVYIHGLIKKKGAKTLRYGIRRNDSTGWGHWLGIIKWNSGWRQYAFFPEEETSWNNSCLKQIQKFLIDVNKKHRSKKK